MPWRDYRPEHQDFFRVLVVLLAVIAFYVVVFEALVAGYGSKLRHLRHRPVALRALPRSARRPRVEITGFQPGSSQR